MNPFAENIRRVTRRQLFGHTATGLGAAALSSLLGGPAYGAAQAAGVSGFPNFPGKAKRVIYLWQGGGPSHIDLLDPKPTLERMAMQDIPESIRGTTRLSTMSSSNKKWPIVPAIKPFQNGAAAAPKSAPCFPTLAASPMRSRWCGP